MTERHASIPFSTDTRKRLVIWQPFKSDKDPKLWKTYRVSYLEWHPKIHGYLRQNKNWHPKIRFLSEKRIPEMAYLIQGEMVITPSFLIAGTRSLCTHLVQDKMEGNGTSYHRIASNKRMRDAEITITYLHNNIRLLGSQLYICKWNSHRSWYILHNDYSYVFPWYIHQCLCKGKIDNQMHNSVKTLPADKILYENWRVLIGS